MNDIPQCPKCGSEYTYFDGSLFVCPDCAHEFNATDNEPTEENTVAKDSNGAELFDGDAVTVIKDLKVKGSSMVIKRGTKVKSIRLTDNPEERRKSREHGPERSGTSGSTPCGATRNLRRRQRRPSRGSRRRTARTSSSSNTWT